MKSLGIAAPDSEESLINVTQQKENSEPKKIGTRAGFVAIIGRPNAGNQR